MLLTRKKTTGPGRTVRINLGDELSGLAAEYAAAAGYGEDLAELALDALAHVISRDREFWRQRGGKNGDRG